MYNIRYHSIGVVTQPGFSPDHRAKRCVLGLVRRKRDILAHRRLLLPSFMEQGASGASEVLVRQYLVAPLKQRQVL